MRHVARGLLLTVAAFTGLLAPSASFSETDITSKTYLKFYQDARDDVYSPLYEYLEVESRELGNGQLSLYLSGWAGRDFRSVAADNEESRDELTYAFLRYSPYADRSLLVTAGRQYVFEGVASEQFDGLSARWEISRYTGLSFFGGGPVETEFDGRTSDSVYGGRVYQRVAQKAEFGLSAFREENAGARFREEAGMDVWLLPVRAVEIKGQSSYNTLTDGWREHAYVLRAAPHKRLAVSGLFSRTNYRDAFSVRTLSVFSPEFVGQDERLTKQGGSAEYRIAGDVTGVVDYVNYQYQTAGDAAWYGAKVSGSISGVTAGFAFHRMAGAVEQLQYLETRLFAAADLDDWRVTFDAIRHHYNTPFSGVGDTYGLNGTLRYAISDSLAAAMSVDYSRTPDFHDYTAALLNLVYTYKSGR